MDRVPVRNGSEIYLLRNRDNIYGSVFRKQVAVMNIKAVLNAARFPWQSVYGTGDRMDPARMLDHVIILGKEGLRRVLARLFVTHNSVRHYLSLDKDAPKSMASTIGTNATPPNSANLSRVPRPK